MQLEQAIYSLMSATTAITDLVGYKIFPQVIPQDCKLPAVAFSRVSGPRKHAQGSDPGVAFPRIQFDVYADTYGEIKDIGAQLRVLWQDHSGLTGGVGGVTILAVEFDGDTDIYEPEQKDLHTVFDFIIWHLE